MAMRNHATIAALMMVMTPALLITALTFSEAVAQTTPATQNKRPLSDIRIHIGGNRQKDEADDSDGVRVAAKPDWDELRKAQQRGEIYSITEIQSEARKYQERGAAFIQNISVWATQTQSADVPVLLPASDAGADQSSLAIGENYYDYQSRQTNGDNLVVSGVCGGTRLPDDHPIAQRMRKQRKSAPRLSRLDARYKISESERGHVLNFAKFNCSYELILNCPGGCNHEAKLIGHAESLGVLNAR